MALIKRIFDDANYCQSENMVKAASAYNVISGTITKNQFVVYLIHTNKMRLR